MSDKHLARGIYQTPNGFRVVLRINGELHRKRFPPSYTLAALKRWRDDHEQIHRRRRSRGLFDDDVAEYLRAVQAMPSIADRTREIEAWLPIFGTRPRWSIASSEIREQLGTWRATLAASTCNHRRTALSHLFTVLDGKNAPNPVREVPPFKEPAATRRGVDVAVALAAIRRIRWKPTRARLLVLLWTGMRPSELMRVTADHLDLEIGLCYVTPSKGGRPRTIPLNKSARKAFRRLVALDALGSFSVATARHVLAKACKQAPTLPVLRIYDLRHTYASAMRTAGADLADVGEQLGHRSPRMTMRYAPVVLEKLRRASEDTRKFPTKVPRDAKSL